MSASSHLDELSPRLRAKVFTLLGVSLACNIAALLLPFMNLRVGVATTPYRLTNSVEMLWDSGLYVLALLVVGFSVIFPFAKLGALAVIASHTSLDETRRKLLHWLELLGKWSMLDVFLVCIILSLTSDQMFVGAKPLVGIPLFVCAIMLSMTAGELITRAISRPVRIRPEDAEPARGGLWLSLYGIALLGTLTFPFLQIDDWKLSNHGYSIVTLVWTLLRDGAISPGLISAAFLLVLPVWSWIASWHWWRGVRRGQPDGSFHAKVLLLRRWSMLDVFGLALAIFAVEGEYLMKTEVRWGALFLAAGLTLQKALQTGLDRAVKH